MTILGILAGAAAVTTGMILAKRSVRKVWHIITVAGALIFAASLYLMICTLLLTEGIQNQQPTDSNLVDQPVFVIWRRRFPSGLNTTILCPCLLSRCHMALFPSKEQEAECHISEEEAIAQVKRAMDERNESASVFIFTGSEIIEGEHCLTLSAGSYSADGQKYTAMYHYAVSDSGAVYTIDVLQGADWSLYRRNGLSTAIIGS